MGDKKIERIPMDLAPTPILKVEPPRNPSGAALLRTVPIPPQQSRYLAASNQTSTPSTPSSALPKQGSVQRLEAVSGASSVGQTVVNRITTMPVAGTTSSYHVPRGAAAVANIAVPRSSLATPIIRGSSTLQTIGVATSSSQQGLIRAVSPVGGRGATSWVGVTATQAGTVRPASNSFSQNRMAVATRVGPGTTVSTRPVLLQATPPHKQLSIAQSPSQMPLSEKKVVTKGPIVGPAPAAVRGVSQSQGVRLGSVVGSGGSTGSRLAPPLRPVSLHPSAVLVSSPTPPPTIQIQSPARPATVSVLTSAVRVTSTPSNTSVQGSKIYCQPPESSVYIQATHKPAQGANVVSIPNSLYSLPANTYYESSTNMRTFTSAPVSTTAAVQQPRPALTQVQGLVSTVPVRLFNPRMVVDSSVHPYVPSESAQTIQTENCNNASNQQLQPQPQQTVHVKQNASPRPSILRKRDTEGTPGKAAKNLNPIFGTLSVSTPSSPPRPESRGAGGAQSSGGSTTISATSSPGLDTTSVSPPLPSTTKDHTEDDRPLEMSPRKKPRKQQLTGNQIQEPKFSEEEMEFIPSEKIKKTSKDGLAHDAMIKTSAKRPIMSMLRTYRPTWKTKHNHFLRYSDVKPKEEKRPSVGDIASQRNVLQRCNGWKVYHLAAQMTSISDLEMDVFDKLTAVLRAFEKKAGKDGDLNRVNELIKGNIQRSKVIADQLAEAKCQVMKLFDHKCQVTEMLNRFSSRRSGKKRERV